MIENLPKKAARQVAFRELQGEVPGMRDEASARRPTKTLDGATVSAHSPGTPGGHERMALLALENLHLSFGGVAALAGVSLEINAGDFFAIIGPNGAGKTSIFNCISGIYAPARGRIVFDGRDITRLKPHQRAELRIARTFQNIALFRGMSVLDNVKIGRHVHLRSGVLACGLYYGRAAREEQAHRAIVEREIIDLLELQDIRHKIVGTLPYGQQKRVELARALALDPVLLLLDEPTAGMNAEETEDMVRFILYVARVKRLTVVLIEHDMGVVMDISDRVAVLDFGKKIAEGAPAQVDRKSTRLNSSHSQISYAVFCLKKKTNNISIQHTVPSAPPEEGSQPAAGAEQTPAGSVPSILRLLTWLPAYHPRAPLRPPRTLP